MSSIGSSQLHVVLSALGEQLALAGERAHLVVIDGSGLIAIDVVARATRDVDIVALEVDGALVSADPLPETVARAGAVVARDFDDLRRLAPTEPELHDAARWARTHNMPGPFDDALARALADLGVEDAGRDA